MIIYCLAKVQPLHNFHTTGIWYVCVCVPLVVPSLSVSSFSVLSGAALLCSGNDWGQCSCAAGEMERMHYTTYCSEQCSSLEATVKQAHCSD